MAAKKSVLFVLGRWDIGGVERVTAVLGKALAERGWRVTVVAFEIGERDLLKTLPPEVMVKTLSFPVGTAENLKAMRALLLAREVSVIVNQWALPYGVTRFLRRAAKNLDVRLAEVLHNIPDNNGRIASSRGLKRLLWRWISGMNLRLNYRACDAFVVLSKRFEPIFRRMTRLADTPKLHTVPNPLTLPPGKPAAKAPSVLYVGRLEEVQKRVSRILEVWRVLEPQFPEWRLDIVGDGPDRNALERRAEGLKRVRFHGFRNPTPFYAEASVLLLTSEFEGFGLVLVEAMAARCVPVVLGSYPAAYDIVHGTDGVVVAPPFDCTEFAQVVGNLMRHPDLLGGLATVACETARTYSLEAVVARWERLFEDLTAERSVCHG